MTMTQNPIGGAPAVATSEATIGKPRRRGIFKKILLVLALIISVFLIVVAMQPADFRVERKASMAAAPSRIFGEVNDFHRWPEWSPWAKLDPAMKSTYEGPAAGVGAVYAWVGNDEVGEGRMTITESRPDEFLRVRLEFIRPFAATNNAEFTLAPSADGTMVMWAMTGRKNFIMKAFCMFMDMDSMVGKDFEKGLAQMKALVETAPAK
jgi:hypothetical protein